MGEFSGKIALVTGGGSGIGRATCEAFGREGANVVVSDINPAGGEETVRLVKAAGGDASFIKTDVSDPASVDRLFDTLLAEHGRLDCAVNNAGIDPEMDLESTWEIDMFERINAINVRSVVLCMKREIAQMQAQGGGKIVNLASLAGVAGIAHKPFYCASKHAVVGLTKAAGLRYIRDGINVNAVCPGGTHTPMLEENMARMPKAAGGGAPGSPAARFAEAWELAEAVLFLSSQKANFIVGHPLSVDGGHAAR